MEVNDFQLSEMRFLSTRETSIYTVNVTRERTGQEDFSLTADRVLQTGKNTPTQLKCCCECVAKHASS